MNSAFRTLGTCLSAAILTLSLSAVPASAAGSKAYIDFGATGSSVDLPAKSMSATPATWYAVSSFQFGAGKSGVVPSVASGTGAGKIRQTKPTAESMDVTLSGDGADKAFELAQKGDPISAVRLDIVSGNKLNPSKMDPKMSVLMSNVQITSVAWTGKGDRSSTTVTLNYERIEIVKAKTGTPLGTGDVTVTGWDQVQNKNDAIDAWNTP